MRSALILWCLVCSPALAWAGPRDDAAAAEAAGDREAAVAAWRRVVEAEPTAADAYEAMGKQLARLKRFDEAVTVFETLVARVPEYGRGQYRLGFALRKAGRLPAAARADILRAVRLGLNVDCGLHDFLSEDAELAAEAALRGARLRDVRKPPPRALLHSFSGEIEEVSAFRVAVLGTDSAVGKRTTAWVLVDAFRSRGLGAELVGTGQTAWMQGARHGIVLDALPNDFVAGEIEHAVVEAWRDGHPDVLVLEGQGSLMNPAYPGGYELLAAGRPHAVVLQHAPARQEYDGFPGYAIHPLDHQIRAVEVVSGKPVVAVAINSEGLRGAEIDEACATVSRDTGLPAADVLRHGASALLDALERVRRP